MKKKDSESIPFGKHVLANSIEHGEPILASNTSLVGASKSGGDAYFLSGNLTSACNSAGLRCPPVDIRHGYTHDLSRMTAQNFLLSLVSSGIIWMVHLGTSCTIWSRERHAIRDLYRAKCKELLGIRFAIFSARLIHRQLATGNFFSLENPWGSLLWKFDPITQIFVITDVSLLFFDACQYGVPFKKSTAILTNLPSLAQLAKRCDGRHTHVALRGSWNLKRDGKWVFENKTTTAGSVTLCSKWASILAAAAPSSGVGSYGADDDWFCGRLESAAQQNLSRLGKSWQKGPSQFGGVSVEDFQRILDRGVVLGQHSKEEACKLGGAGFGLKYPLQRLPEEEDSNSAWLDWQATAQRPTPPHSSSESENFGQIPVQHCHLSCMGKTARQEDQWQKSG